MNGSLMRTLTLVTATVVPGEALALAVGMHVLSPPGNPWISLKNDLLLALDVLTGLGLLLVTAKQGHSHLLRAGGGDRRPRLS